MVKLYLSKSFYTHSRNHSPPLNRTQLIKGTTFFLRFAGDSTYGNVTIDLSEFGDNPEIGDSIQYEVGGKSIMVEIISETDRGFSSDDDSVVLYKD